MGQQSRWLSSSFPRQVRTDSYLSCLDFAATKRLHCFPGQMSDLGSQKISKATHFAGKPWPSAYNKEVSDEMK